MNNDGNMLVKVVCVQWQAVCQFGLYELIIFLCRKVAVINLDPANDSLPYPLSLKYFTNVVVDCSIIISIGNFLDVNIDMSVM